MTVRRQYNMSDDAAELICTYAPSERKQSEWLSAMVVKYHALLNDNPSSPQTGHLESIDSTLDIVRRQNAAILKRLDEIAEKIVT